MLPVSNVAMTQNFVAISDKFSVAGICANGNCKQHSITELYIY